MVLIASRVVDLNVLPMISLVMIIPLIAYNIFVQQMSRHSSLGTHLPSSRTTGGATLTIPEVAERATTAATGR